MNRVVLDREDVPLSIGCGVNIFTPFGKWFGRGFVRGFVDRPFGDVEILVQRIDGEKWDFFTKEEIELLHTDPRHPRTVHVIKPRELKDKPLSFFFGDHHSDLSSLNIEEQHDEEMIRKAFQYLEDDRAAGS